MISYNNNNDTSDADTKTRYQVISTSLLEHAGSTKPARRGFCIKKTQNGVVTFLEPDYLDEGEAIVELNRLSATGISN